MHPVFKSEFLPRNVEVAFWFVEAERNNEKNWRKQIEKPQTREDVQCPMCNLASYAHHAKSSVPKILV
jgi:hypothetical protein